MPRGLHNWTFKDIQKFLHKRGFTLLKVIGSHHYFLKKENDKEFLPQVPFHGTKAIHPKTMETIIAKSGISRKEWEGKLKKKNEA